MRHPTVYETFRYFWREAAILYYEAAIRSIDPLHEDVPFIVRRINELKCERLKRHGR